VLKERSANSGSPATGAPEIIWQLSTIYLMQFEIQQNTHYPYAGYVVRLGPLGKFVENSTNYLALNFPSIVSRTVQCYGV
jgi:hypothetical protein